MLKFCEVTVIGNSGGNIYPLNNIEKWHLEVYDGLGIPNVARHAERGPFQSGDTDLGFTLMPRFLSLSWVLFGCDPRDVWDLRCELISIFRPRSTQPVQLTYYLPNGEVVSSDVQMTGVLEYPTASRLDGSTQRVAITLKASDPRLYNPTSIIVEFTTLKKTDGWNIEEPATSSVLDGWTVEEPGASSELGWNIGSGEIDATEIIQYGGSGCANGDIEYPVITINGALQNPVIENVTTGEILPLNANGGLQVASGDYVVIDLNYGKKTIIDNNGNSVDEFLDTNNDLATFHLAYNGEEKPDGSGFYDGSNEIKVTATNASANSSIVIEYFERFIGV